MRTRIDRSQQIQTILDDIQIRARSRTLTATDLLALAQQAEEELDRLMVPQRLRAGSRYTYAQHVYACKAYAAKAFGAAATSIVLERRSRHWYLVEAERCMFSIRTHGGFDGELRVTPEARDHLARRFTAGVKVIQPAE